MPSPTLRRRQLGRELRALRENAGLSRQDAATALGVVATTLYRVEGGTTGLQPAELTAMLDLYKVTDSGERERLEQLRAEARRRGWWSVYRSALPSSFQTFIGLEDAAVARRDFAAVLIPGVLQTRRYAAAVMETANPPLDQLVIDQRLDVRLRRQDLILREGHPLPLHVILDESCLHRRVGGPEVWHEQLRHLLDLATRRNITLQVLPFTAGAVAQGLVAFVLLDFDEGSPIAYAEQPAGDLYAEGDDALRYAQHFDALRTDALAPSLSADLIHQILAKGST